MIEPFSEKSFGILTTASIFFIDRQRLFHLRFVFTLCRLLQTPSAELWERSVFHRNLQLNIFNASLYSGDTP